MTGGDGGEEGLMDDPKDSDSLAHVQVSFLYFMSL